MPRSLKKPDPAPWEDDKTAPARPSGPTSSSPVPAVRPRGPMAAHDDSDESFGELRRDSFEVPRFKLIHPVSPEIQSQKEARSGEFWHSALSKNLGPRVRVTLLRQTPYLGLLEPNTGKLLARATMDGEWDNPGAEFHVEIGRRPVVWNLGDNVRESGLGVMGSSGGFWAAATPCYDAIFWLHVSNMEMPAMYSFKKTAARPFRELLTIIEMRKQSGLPRYRQMYDLQARLVQGPNTAYHVPYFTAVDALVEDELFERLSNTAKVLAQTKIQVVGDDAETGAGPAGPRNYDSRNREI